MLQIQASHLVYVELSVKFVYSYHWGNNVEAVIDLRGDLDFAVEERCLDVLVCVIHDLKVKLVCHVGMVVNKAGVIEFCHSQSVFTRVVVNQCD